MAENTQLNRKRDPGGTPSQGRAGGSAVQKSVKPYSFAGKNYMDRSELVRALMEHWDEGKKELFHGRLSDYFSNFDPDAAQICRAAEQEAARISGRDDLIFWKTLYALQPKTREFFWKGQVYAGLPAMGRELLEQLKTNDLSMHDFIDGVLKEELLSSYIRMKEPGSQKMLEAVQELESSYKTCMNNPRGKRITLYLTAYTLSNQKILYIAGGEFRSLNELTSCMKALLGKNNENLEDFKAFCHRLIDHYGNLRPALESWLIAIGKREALEKWKESMKS